jgi:hypothetical protein
MDGLALFCTLHADGPATLRVLREAGCADLSGVEALGAERLADLLEIEPAAARRLVREARALAERLGEGALEREEAPPGGPAAPLGPPSAALGPAASAPAPGSALPAGERRILERVLEAWRDRDRGELDAAGASVHDPVHDTVLGRAEEIALQRESELREDDPEPEHGAPRGPALEPHALDGLDEATARALQAAGLGTLGELADAEPLEIAEATGISYTRARRLVFLAGRRMALHHERVSPADRPALHPAGGVERDLLPRAVPARELSPGRARSSPGEGSGGPFA